MTLALGTVRPGSTILIPFNTFDSNDPSASVIVSDFVLADIGIYKGLSMTERGSTTGVVLLDTDGINIDAAVGIHGFTIDLSSNATDDFYTAGSRYYVTVGPITVDAATVNFVAATFEIGYPGAILDGQIATLASQTSFTITNAPTDDSSLVGCTVIVHDQASATQFAVGYVSAYTTAADTITLKADPGIFTMAAGDNVSFFMPANVQAVAGTTQTAGDLAALLTIIDTNVDDIEAILRTLSDAFVLTSAVIETVTSQTALVLPATADAVADQAYHGAIAVLIDDGDPNNKSFQVIETYDAGTRTITLARAPTFTVTTSDVITILATTDAGGVWDMILTGLKHNIPTSAGRRVRELEESIVQASGTIVTVTNGHTFTLDTGAVATADYYPHSRLTIAEGTGAGQSRLIAKYTAGRVVTLTEDFTTNPDTSSLYLTEGADAFAAATNADLAVGFIAAFTNVTTVTLDDGALADADYYVNKMIVFSHGTGAGQSALITDYTAGRVVTMEPALDADLSTDTTWHIVATSITPKLVNAEVDNALDTVIPGSPTADSINEVLQRLGRSADMIQEYTIDNTGLTADATDCRVDAVSHGTLEATDDHFIGRVMMFTSGALIYQATDVTDYDGGNKQFTYTALTEAPADDDTFILV